MTVPLTSVPNLRDIGGYRSAEGGRVRHGVLYRSTDLSRLTEPDEQEFARLRIATVYDLRTVDERTAAPDRLPAGTRALDLDVLADKRLRAIPAQMLAVIADPSIADRELGGGRAEEYFVGSYRDFVTLPSAVSAYRALFGDLAALPDDGPALVHCTTGKDRTGWATASLLLLLGVDEDDVFQDYLLTNELLLPALGEVFERFAAAGGDPELLEPVLGVRPEYLHAALATVREHFGSIEGYFGTGLGLGEDVQTALRERLITA
ncbi:tyrosine-protein phosphatase [Rhodococcus triatomae]|uniref:Protein-tyrosine phosphatase n=1 Tax=Rhodococcus triatomae TaxID=300028 RepID=A0A1G8FFY4_9NOCA|nr:tyrosine-protein phosphatase [Rhodococcus triatomae]QNG19471.1 tyrosine-protein phosphatase [Rhodococcus triatomae]QNG24614.1 tyrosine-protein phosphatase [Rhodococcus triatomae]SDH80929.1 protein-tyrosine phosphatase [Rhodococcus triatomae]